MSVTDLRTHRSPDPEQVSLLLQYGLTDPRCGQAVLADVDAARRVLDAAQLIATLKMSALWAIANMVRGSGAKTAGEFYEQATDEQRATLDALGWLEAMPSPVGEQS